MPTSTDKVEAAKRYRERRLEDVEAGIISLDEFLRDMGVPEHKLEQARELYQK